MQEQRSDYIPPITPGSLDPASGLTDVNITYADVGLAEYQQMFSIELRKIKWMIENIQSNMVEVHDRIISIEEKT